jgi:hypothetical protein
VVVGHRTFLYAYGLDANWAGREDLFLARIPRASIMEVNTWQWWTGNGNWSAPGEPSTRQPVLHDDRLPPGRISQGGVVYDRPLNRYLYSTWIESRSDVTMHIYEAPAPWGPWSIAMTKSFGPKCLDQSRAAWHRNLHGGYATTMPAKFISSDGRTLWLQSNVLYIFDEANPDPASCPKPDPDLNAYGFSLRPVWLTTPDNLVRDPGFEGQQRYEFLGAPLPFGPIGPPWSTEGPDSHGLDSALGLSRQGANNAWIHPSNRASRAWNAVTQKVAVTPHTRCTATGRRSCRRRGSAPPGRTPNSPSPSTPATTARSPSSPATGRPVPTPGCGWMTSGSVRRPRRGRLRRLSVRDPSDVKRGRWRWTSSWGRSPR